MKVVLWGCGLYYENRRDSFAFDEIVAFIDNDTEKQGRELDDVRIFSPSALIDGTIPSANYDYIVIMTIHYNTVYRQLTESMRIVLSKILDYDRYLVEQQRKQIMKEWIYNSVENIRLRRIVFIVREMHFDGGIMAAIHAAQAIMTIGIICDIMAPSCADNLADIVRKKGIGLYINKELNGPPWYDISFLKKYDLALINTALMIPLTKYIVSFMPVCIWIHENDSTYKSACLYPDDVEAIRQSTRLVCSKRAGNIFIKRIGFSSRVLYPATIDKANKTLKYPRNANRVSFVIIGGISNRKGQDIALEALAMLDDDELIQISLYLVGEINEKSNFSKYVKNIVIKLRERGADIHFTGVMNEEGIQALYGKVDCLLCPSREETLSLAVVEAMMNSRIVVTSSETGIAELIKNGVDGYIFLNEDIAELVLKIKQVLYMTNTERVVMGENARKIYENHFTQEKFKNQFMEEATKTISAWKWQRNLSEHAV